MLRGALKENGHTPPCRKEPAEEAIAQVNYQIELLFL